MFLFIWSVIVFVTYTISLYAMNFWGWSSFQAVSVAAIVPIAVIVFKMVQEVVQSGS